MLKKILFSSLFIISYVFSGILFWGEHSYMLPFNLIVTFVISFFIFKKSANAKLDYFIINVPFFSLLIFTSIIGKDFSRLMTYIIFVPLSSLIGYWFIKDKNLLKVILSFLLILITSNLFKDNFFSYYHNKNGQKDVPFPKVSLTDSNKNKIILNKNKIIVLDFWSTSCSICFKKFPDLEDTFKKYQLNKDIEIYSLNVPLKNDDFQNTTKILDSIGYSFPKLYAVSAKEIKDSLDIDSFPHLLIIKNGKIRFDGMLETNRNVRIYSIDSEIQRLIDEK